MKRICGLRLNHATALAYLALFVALGGGALAATSFVGSNGQIRGCVSGKGQLTLLKPANHCKHGQTQIAWNQEGPPGAKGADGDPSTPGQNAAHATKADFATITGNADTLNNKDSTAFAPVGSEPWHAAALNNGEVGGRAHATCYWQPFPRPDLFRPPGYFRDGGGTVHLRGLPQSVNGDSFKCLNNQHDRSIFSLPPGYRPDVTQTLYTLVSNNPGRIDVAQDGTVAGNPTFQGSGQYVSLDGLTFRCAPSGQDGCP